MKPLLGFISFFIAGCNSATVIEFPAQILSGYAFVVYSDGDSPVDISPIRNAQYYEKLVISARSELDYDTIDLYTLDPNKLVDLAKIECRTVDSAKGRVSCLQAVTGCEGRADCWQASSASEGCGERIRLNIENTILEYFRESGGIFVPQSPQSPGQSDLVICGPVATPDCPYRTPSYVVTKDGFFHCNAESTQQSCNLSLDFSECGIDAVAGTLDESGRFEPASESLGRCTLEESSNDDVSSLGPADFSILCPEERYEVTYTDNILGAELCPYLGPSTFDNDSNIGSEITGLVNYGDTYTVMVGSGENQCAYYGYYCSLRDSLCIDCCYDACNAYLMTRCVDRDDQKTCAESPRSECIEQCRKCCSDSSGCTRSYREGHSAVVIDPAKPYAFLSRVKIEPVGEIYKALHQGQAVAKLNSSPESHQFIVGLSNAAVFFEVRNNTELLKAAQSIETSFKIQGLYHNNQKTYLTGSLTSSIAAILVVDYTNISEPSQNYSTRLFEFPSIEEIEHVAFADSRIFLADSRLENGRHVSRILSLEESTMQRITEIEIPGRISVLKFLDQSLIVSSFDETKQQETFNFYGQDFSNNDQASLQMLRGLSIKASLIDADSGRLYLGLKISSRTGSLGSGALSILERTEGGYRVLPPLFVTSSGVIDLLHRSHDGSILYSISRTKNWIMPFEIYRDD
ncbi:MAG: hypothetical protein VYC39_02955 [Myxococcota bacterium]|nr:hypothetical protein [Myxococcota bacterium]